MELYNILKKEIDDLRLTDEYEIAYYIYIRMGEMFDYDTRYEFDDDKVEELRNLKVDIRNVTFKDLTCFSWAHLYVDILMAFGIEAWYRGSKYHAYVEFKANGKNYIADLMKGYIDISLIKFGFPVKFLIEKGKNQAENNTRLNAKFGLRNYISPQKLLEMLFEEIRKKDIDLEGQVYMILKFLEKYLAFYKGKIGYTSGRKMIAYVLNEFKKIDYNMGEYYDVFKDDYVLLYYLSLDIYFAYQKDESGSYEFKEINEEQAEEIMNSYETDKERCLTYYQFS